MGWDIVSIGTHHKLPINKPELIAEKLVQLIKNPIEVGYFEEWTYNSSQNKIIKQYKKDGRNSHPLLLLLSFRISFEW